MLHAQQAGTTRRRTTRSGSRTTRQNRLAACAGLLEPTGPHVDARLTTAGLLASNHTAADIYFTAFEREIVALIEWVPCSDPATCRPRLTPAADTTIPYASIYGWGPASREVVCYWWHSVPNGAGGYRPDSIRGLVVKR